MIPPLEFFLYLELKYNHFQGYLPPKDVVQLSLAYSTVFHMKIEIDDLRDAVEQCLSGRSNLINIEAFIKHILSLVLNNV